MLVLYLLTRIVYILLFNHIEAVNPTHINMRNCQIQLSIHVNITEKMTLLKKCGMQIWLCLFIIWAFNVDTVKQLNCNRNVQLTLWCRGNTSDCGASGQELCLLFCFIVVVCLHFVQNTLFVMNFAISFAMLIHLVYFTYCQICD